jgi:hypothetical protein
MFTDSASKNIVLHRFTPYFFLVLLHLL